MRVLNVNVMINSRQGGGAAERTAQTSRFLAKAGVDCTILTMDLGLTQECLKVLNGVRVTALTCLFKRFYFPKLSYSKIKNIVAESDVIHLMGHWTFLNAMVYLIVRLLNKPYVVCPAGMLPVYGRSKIIKKLYNLLIGNSIIRNANGYIAISLNEIDQFLEYGIEKEKVSIIPNGIDPEDYKIKNYINFKKKYGLGDDPFILFMGRLNPIKGPDLLLNAFCNVKGKLNNYNLVFAGPDEGMLPVLKKIANNSGIEDRIYFTGYLDGEEKSSAYHAANLLAIPSRKEAMSIVVLEAGITKTPVLITDQCGFDEVADINGGRVVSASVDGLQNGLIEILKDSDELSLMGANLEKYTRRHFIWDAVINKYIKLYQNILE